jgi:hypothetical protein
LGSDRRIDLTSRENVVSNDFLGWLIWYWKAIDESIWLLENSVIDIAIVSICYFCYCCYVATVAIGAIDIAIEIAPIGCLIGSSAALFQRTVAADWFDIRKRSTNRYDFSGTALFQTTVSTDWFDIGSDWRIGVNYFCYWCWYWYCSCYGLIVGCLIGSSTALFQTTVSADWFDIGSDRRIDMTSRWQRCFERLSWLIDLILEVVDESV